MNLSSLIKTIDCKRSGLYEMSEDDLKQVHRVYIDMLKDIIEICEENKINWSLSGGSILGAVRHQGFIPWDDDIDLFMTRGEFERFKKVFPGKYANQYELKLPGSVGYLMHYPQIYKKNTTVQLIQSSDETNSCLFIDIFILENTYDNNILRKLYGWQCTMLLFIDSVMRTERCKNNLLKYGKQNRELCSAVKKRIFFAKFFSFFPLERWLAISDKCFSKVKNTRTHYVVAPGGAKHYFGEIFERKKICIYEKVPFENIKCPIPLDYDYYLKQRYGNDYMVPPLEENKERHSFVKFDLGKSGKI